MDQKDPKTILQSRTIKYLSAPLAVAALAMLTVPEVQVWIDTLPPQWTPAATIILAGLIAYFRMITTEPVSMPGKKKE